MYVRCTCGDVLWFKAASSICSGARSRASLSDPLPVSQDSGQSAAEQTKETAEHAKGTLERMAEKVKETAHNVYDRVTGAADEASLFCARFDLPCCARNHCLFSFNFCTFSYQIHHAQ